MTTRTIVALAAIGVLAGCATDSAVQANYGSAAASLIAAQTANPDTLTNPSTAIVTGVDGEYAYKVIDEMRKDVSKPVEVKEPIQMLLLGQGGR